MSFLGELAIRLKTDVGETARAAADPVFAAALTERNFKREAREEIREADAAKLQEQRDFDEQQRQLQVKSASQMKLINDAISDGQITGNFDRVINIVDGQNTMPEVAQFGESFLNSKPGISAEAARENARISREVSKLENDGKKIAVSERNAATAEGRLAQDKIVQGQKDSLAALTEVIRKNQDLTDVQSLINAVETNASGLWSDAEKANITSTLATQPNPKQALQYFRDQQTIAMQKLQLTETRLKAQRKAEEKERNRTSALPGNPTKVDQQLARTAIIQSELIGEEAFFELETDASGTRGDEQSAVVNAVAQRARELARHARSSDVQSFIGQAIADVAPAITFERGGMGGLLNDTAEFDIQKVRPFSSATVVQGDGNVRTLNADGSFTGGE